MLLARAESAAPSLKAPLRMLLKPLCGDLLPLNEAGHRAGDIDRGLLFPTYVGTARQADDKNERNHLECTPVATNLHAAALL